MKYLLFILLLALASCKNTVSELSKDKTVDSVVINDKKSIIEDAKDKSLEILKMIKSGQNQKVLDNYYGIEMNDQTKELLTNMNNDVLEGINKFGLPDSTDIEVSTMKTLTNSVFADDFKNDSVTIVTTRSKLNGTEQFVVQIMYVENKGTLLLLNIGTDRQNE